MMKLSTISAIHTVVYGALLALAKPIEPPAIIESANSTHEASELIDSLVWLDDDVLPYVGDKIPGDNFLSLCDGDHSGDVVSIDEVNLTPNPPVKGKELTVEAVGTIKSLVSAGTKIWLKVKLGHSTVYRKKFDLCEEIEKIGGQCPISSGTTSVVKNFTVSRKIPSGKYSAHINVVAADGSPITCLEGSFKLGKA